MIYSGSDSRSGSCKKFRIRPNPDPAPDPQHCPSPCVFSSVFDILHWFSKSRVLLFHLFSLGTQYVTDLCSNLLCSFNLPSASYCIFMVPFQFSFSSLFSVMAPINEYFLFGYYHFSFCVLCMLCHLLNLSFVVRYR
jgi:hypothetical protein